MDQLIWELIRASGITAVVLLTVAVAMGVSVDVRALDSFMKRAWVNEAHQFISLTALAVMVFHLVLVVLNRHVPINLVEALVPFASGWRPVALALGTGGLYLSAVLILSSCFKPAIGHRAWRMIHYGGFLGWLAAISHGVTAGSDTDVVWMQYVYLASFSVVTFLTAFRVLALSRKAMPAAGSSRTPALGRPR